MKQSRSTATRRASRISLVATSLVAACSVFGVAVLSDTAVAATKTTKKVASKAKTTTTKKRKPPAPAKGAKRIGGLWQPNAGRTGAAAPLNFDPSPKSGDTNNPSAPNEAAAYALVEPTNVFSILVVGTDARPGERPEKARGDSIHLFTYNPVLKKGALVGFPRDSYVQAPSGETRKINEIMSTAGPDAFLASVNGLSGLATKRWILTGFDGFAKIVDGVGGVVIKIDPSINDVSSGAQFAAGWFQFNGAAALAYSRARKALITGDFGRSANQGKLIIAGFARLRESTDNIRALLNWVLVMRKNTVSNVKTTDWMSLAQVARGIDQAGIISVVLSGASETVDGSDVIRLDEANMKAVFTDLADGVLGN
jgi:polyisoprenyl-teichoic acid--peptidoglycan teichoic acid transferase